MHAVNTQRDNVLAKACMNCPVCRRARQKQHGFAYELVKKAEGSVCPFGRSYARVYGRKPHELVAPS